MTIFGILYLIGATLTVIIVIIFCGYEKRLDVLKNDWHVTIIVLLFLWPLFWVIGFSTKLNSNNLYMSEGKRGRK